MLYVFVSGKFHNFEKEWKKEREKKYKKWKEKIMCLNKCLYRWIYRERWAHSLSYKQCKKKISLIPIAKD